MASTREPAVNLIDFGEDNNDNIDSVSVNHDSVSNVSKRTNVSTSVIRAQERAKIAELLTERKYLDKSQEIQRMQLEINIAKAQAREKSLTELVHEEENELIVVSEINSVENVVSPGNQHDTRTVHESSNNSTPIPHIQNNGHSFPAREKSLTELVHEEENELIVVSEINSVENVVSPGNQHDTRTVHESSNNSTPIPHIQNNGHSFPERSPLQSNYASQQPPVNNELSANAIPFEPMHLNDNGNYLKSNPPPSTRVDNSTDDILTMHKQLMAAMSLPQPEIKKFKGDAMEYDTFRSAFVARISSKLNDPADRLYYLQQLLEDEPRYLIDSCLHLEPNEGFQEAVSLLDNEYGDPYKVSTAYINKVLNWATIKDDVHGLKSFLLYLVKCRNAMSGLSYMSVLNHPPNLQAIIQKLPFYLQSKWRERVMRLRKYDHRIPDFSDIVEFVKDAVESANDPIFGKEALTKPSTNISRPFKPMQSNKLLFGKEKSFATNFQAIKSSRPELLHGTGYPQSNNTPNQSNSSSKCVFCSGYHDLNSCPDFFQISLDRRKEFLLEKRLCFGCLSNDHFAKGCLKRSTCYKCNGRHLTVLHDDNFVLKRDNLPSTKDTSLSNKVELPAKTCSATGPINSIILQSIIPVLIQHKNSHKVVKTYAFYDNGSSGCFITKSIQDKIGVTGSSTKLNLGTMLGQDVVDSEVLNGLLLSDVYGENTVELPKMYTRNEIPVTYEQIPTPETVSYWEHLRDVASKIAPYDPKLEIGLLIGSDCPVALEPLEVKPCHGKGPFAMRLIHGWTVNGPLNIESSNGQIMVNNIIVREIEHVKEVLTPKSVLSILEKDFSDLWVNSSAEEYGLSQEDKRFMEIATNGTSMVDGHYEVPLPFRSDDLLFPDNRAQVIKRMEWQRKKMITSPKYYEHYKLFIDNNIAKGYIEKLPVNNTQIEGRTWYLPHHGVYHPRKVDKLRVVFDASAQFNGYSLNNQLLQGPNLTNSLIGVLTRFREEHVAFVADIEGMFHQVNVPEFQRDYLRLFWWKDGDISKELEEFRFTVHLFGATSSPSCAGFALRRTADDIQHKFGNSVSDTIRNNFYVDDCLKSVPDTVTAIQLIKDLKEACSNGGFKLTKVMSNCMSVLKSLPETDRVIDISELNLDFDFELPVERVLGVKWLVSSDSFGFSIVIKDRPLSRRGILSMVSSIYDPLGFVAPVTLIAKKILQELCELNLDWDDPIPLGFQTRWVKWRQTLEAIESIEIQRCVKPTQFDTIISRQLHVFSDASSIAYGAVAYLRLVDIKGNVHCSFLMGKSRLAPIKSVTIPRLELTAATVAAKLANVLVKELETKPDTVICHTDSTTVLRYIRNDHKRFKLFVANRVQVIRNLTDPSHWKYVDTKENPADDSSRGLNGESFCRSNRWLHGPKFLWEPESTWTNDSEVLIPTNDNDLELKTINSNAITVSTDTVQRLIEYFSDWYKLKRAVAVFLKFKAILKQLSVVRKGYIGNQLDSFMKRKRHDLLQGFSVTVTDIRNAELLVFRFVHQCEYAVELSILDNFDSNVEQNRNDFRRKRSCIKSVSHLWKLDPIVQDGVIRVGGRLDRAKMDDSVKHPIIVPKGSHIAKLLIRHFHQSLGHVGRAHVLASLRSKYWLISANSSVRHVISKCVKCRRLSAKPNVQKMANLPTERVNSSNPFDYVGIDYFGPFVIKEGRKDLKRYGVIFTCLSSRSVHLEIANSLESDSFILALRRFIARRGPVKQIRSDNGTNFIGASSELRAALKEMDNDGIRNKLRNYNIEWIFNPPTASHMGGVWERQIRSIRKVLNGLLMENGDTLNDESFRTLMCEVENILNSRPLTFVSSDMDDYEPLTPNHILTMKSQIVLPPPGCFQRADLYLRRRWRRVQYLAGLFWSRWKREYLLCLQERAKWCKPQRNLKIDDIVIISDDSFTRNDWKLGRILATETDKGGLVRAATVHTANGDLRRPVHKLVLLMENEN